MIRNCQFLAIDHKEQTNWHRGLTNLNALNNCKALHIVKPYSDADPCFRPA